MTESGAPYVVSTIPLDNDTNSSCTDNISVTFNEDMDTTSVTTNTDTSCSGTIRISSDNFANCVRMTDDPTSASDNKTFILNPSSDLTSDFTFKIKVTTGVKDPSGNTMSDNYSTGTGFTTKKPC
jgi:hypothetical protein